MKPKRNGSAIFSRNRKAYYQYEILDTFECGIVLSGGEVKSVKSGMASIKESFVQPEAGELWLWNAHIPQWSHTSDSGYDAVRKRKLLLHRREMDALVGKVKEKGMTLVPLRLYGVRGRVKVEVGVCRGRKLYEKRQREKERFLKKELHQEKRKYVV
jgi:SsrA-binding protein